MEIKKKEFWKTDKNVGSYRIGSQKYLKTKKDSVYHAIQITLT